LAYFSLFLDKTQPTNYLIFSNLNAMNTFLSVSLRQQAVFIPQAQVRTERPAFSGRTAVLVANLAKLGFGVSEPLLAALGQTSAGFQAQLLEQVRRLAGVNQNWTPLVKDWGTPTGETPLDHVITFLAQAFGSTKGVRLACGHLIPPGTFALERYNGCPYCGTPFRFSALVNYGQGSKLKVLELWHEPELDQHLAHLLASPTALDATQMDSLKQLLAARPLPAVAVKVKETRMAVIDALVEKDRLDQAQALFASPTDVLRYLWYRQTGFLQIIEPKNLLKRHAKNHRHVSARAQTASAQAYWEAKQALKLKYTRPQGHMVAKWLNGLAPAPEHLAEAMHPKRGMWVRFIRALRLAEFSQKPGFEKLQETLDLFYNQTYYVWQGRVDHYRLRSDEAQTLRLLQQRPGLFARSLFANMLWFGPEPVVAAFAQVVDQLPLRLVFTLAMYARYYFVPGQERTVKPLGGVARRIGPHPLLELYDAAQLEAMQAAITDLCLLAAQKRFAAQPAPGKTMYIDPLLRAMPVPIGDRSENLQDLPAALMGTRLAVQGDTMRLFMQWGQGLPAQPLDMDLSAQVAYPDWVDTCSYMNLTTTGCQHSGDIRSIPDRVGTAEYIELNLGQLAAAGAKFVSFTCNAYSTGALAPNLVVGWMDSRHPMRITAKGVAYDPSCVQQQVRISQPLTKGLVFGVLDVPAREVVWLELPFDGQVVQQLDTRGVAALLAKLDSKLSIGHLLALKAQAQGLQLVDTPAQADEAYSRQWGLDAAAVASLLLG
jgi:hypothetical protein